MLSLYPGIPSRAVAGNLDVVFPHDNAPHNMRFLTSARSGMVLGLRALKFNRMDEILVPPYLGHCVLSALSRASFPVLTATERTKIILVFHQFGFPQKIDDIEAVAKKRGWVILNDCAHLWRGRYKGRDILSWGDWTVLSLPKIFPCVLGGAVVTSNAQIMQAVDARLTLTSPDETLLVGQAFDVLKRAKTLAVTSRCNYDVEAVYGYLPELASFHPQTLTGLPEGKDDALMHQQHRLNIWNIVRKFFAQRVPSCDESDVFPFAVPVALNGSNGPLVCERVRRLLDVDLQLLHFDFARNMLAPDYRWAFVIGCHSGWSEALVENICMEIRRAEA